MEFKLRKDDGEIPVLGSLIRVRLAIALLAAVTFWKNSCGSILGLEVLSAGLENTPPHICTVEPYEVK